MSSLSMASGASGGSGGGLPPIIRSTRPPLLLPSSRLFAISELPPALPSRQGSTPLALPSRQGSTPPALPARKGSGILPPVLVSNSIVSSRTTINRARRTTGDGGPQLGKSLTTRQGSSF
ncbi:hypothetical protein VNI00_013801 [Paramarasmius palmivorus]|uniref:Uncharacterized protein n=1 Tax=Paramarasmius palmivorus TaxID=297713 RepID=A0AAW0BVX5_9AGAR